MPEIEILSSQGGDDGYYWDYRIVFKYKGKVFSYINVGSGSGYIACEKHIGLCDITESLCGIEMSRYERESDEELMRYADMLLDSGETELELEC